MTSLPHLISSCYGDACQFLMPSKLERLSLSTNRYKHAKNVRMCANVPHSREVRKSLGNAKSANKLRIFSGTANPALSREIARSLGLDLGKICIKSLANQEIYVRLEESVMGCDVYIVQPTCTPVNDNLMELIIMIDACRWNSAKTVTAVIPYFGYASADNKKFWRGESLTAKLVANQIVQAGADRVVVIDIHSTLSICSNVPMEHVYCQHVILDYLSRKALPSEDLVVVSPDNQGLVRVIDFAKALCDPRPDIACIDKKRSDHNFTKAINLMGDVQGKVAIMYDDIIDTAGTITEGAALLRREGAKEVYACAIHGVFSPPAIERLSNDLINEVIITNTIPVSNKNNFPRLTVLSVANLLAEKIWKLHSSGKNL